MGWSVYFMLGTMAAVTGGAIMMIVRASRQFSAIPGPGGGPGVGAAGAGAELVGGGPREGAGPGTAAN